MNDIRGLNQQYVQAFESNFGYTPVVEKANKHFFIYRPEQTIEDYFYHCDTIQEVNGFIYGCVKGKRGTV